jgi:hypothetical protein
MNFDNTTMFPSGDLNYNLGKSGSRWNSVWCATSAMSTSDGREKKWLGGLADDELAAAKDLVKAMGIYQWLASLEAKGEDARLHCGIVAQDVEAIMAKDGLDASRYGFFCYDEWEEETINDIDGNPVTTPAGNRYSIRFPDLLAFMMIGQEQRLTALEERL